MRYVDVAGVYLNLDRVAYIRKEEHPQYGMVLAVHFATPDTEPIFLGEQHESELRALLFESAGTAVGSGGRAVKS